MGVCNDTLVIVSFLKFDCCDVLMPEDAWTKEKRGWNVRGRLTQDVRWAAHSVVHPVHRLYGLGSLQAYLQLWEESKWDQATTHSFSLSLHLSVPHCLLFSVIFSLYLLLFAFSFSLCHSFMSFYQFPLPCWYSGLKPLTGKTLRIENGENK